MKTTGKAIILVALVFIVTLLVFGPVTNAKTWSAFQFRGNEMYEYRVIWGDEDREAIYRLSINEKPSGNYSVKYSTEVEIKPSQLSSDVAFGYWGTYGPSLHFMFLNPMYEMLFSQLELKVGEKMSYYGQGTMKVPGKEKIAGRTGFVCQLYDNDENLIAEWVIDPELALPLRSITYEGSGTEGEIILVNYEKL